MRDVIWWCCVFLVISCTDLQVLHRLEQAEDERHPERAGEVCEVADLEACDLLEQEADNGRGDDGEVRLLEVNYDSQEMERRYDPLLFWSAPWRDTFLYGDDGAFEGWLRRTAGGEEKIAPDGFNEQGVLVLYNMQRNQDGTVNLVRRGSSGAAP